MSRSEAETGEAKDGVVHDEGHACADGGQQGFFEPLVEDGGVGRSREQHRRGEFAFFERTDE